MEGLEGLSASVPKLADILLKKDSAIRSSYRFLQSPLEAPTCRKVRA